MRHPIRHTDDSPGRVNRELAWIRRELRELRAARSLEASSVEGGKVTVREILTDPGLATKFVNTDTFTASGPGDMRCPLTHDPLDGSTHVYWNGLWQPPSRWTLTGRALTLLDSDAVIGRDDAVEIAYAYDGLADRSPLPAEWIGIPFLAQGWRWTQVPADDNTDYSAGPEAGWSAGAAPFGTGIPNVWPPQQTPWDIGTRLWAAYYFLTNDTSVGVVATLRADRDAVVWVNGSQVWSGSPDEAEQELAVGAEVLEPNGQNVVVVRVTDEPSGSVGTYFDMRVEPA